jgi:hypothetical protein
LHKEWQKSGEISQILPVPLSNQMTALYYPIFLYRKYLLISKNSNLSPLIHYLEFHKYCPGGSSPIYKVIKLSMS